MKETTKFLNIGQFQEDHVYYDNPYNISIIHTYEGCPFAFTFENLDDWERALTIIARYFSDEGLMITISEIFNMFGLIMDDYPEFENHFTTWTSVDFCVENMKCLWHKYLSFGIMEAPQGETK